MLLLAESWMERDAPAIGFWALILALLAIPISVWAARRFSERDTYLYYDLTETTQLLTPNARLASLTMHHGDAPLNDPYITLLTLAVKSRRDIGKERFSQGPLVIDVGAPIVKDIDTRYSAGIELIPALEYDGTRIHLGPSLIHNDASLTIRLLLEGGPDLKAPLRSMENVKLVQGEPITSRNRAVIGLMIMYSAALITTAISWPHLNKTVIGSAAFAVLLGVYIAHRVAETFLGLTLSGRKKKRR
ncbi:hypothetical protein OG900_06760 [Streptomyces sp. NBC_00433]